MKNIIKRLSVVILCAMLSANVTASPVSSYDFPQDHDEFEGITDGFKIKDGFHNCIYKGKLSTICTFGLPVTYISPELENVTATHLTFSLKSQFAQPASTLEVKIKTQNGDQNFSLPLADTNAHVYTVKFDEAVVTGYEIFVNAVPQSGDMYGIDLEFAYLYNSDKLIHFAIGEGFAVIDGEEKPLDAPAFIAENRTLTPARFVAESLGAEVAWDNTERKVTVTKGDTEIIMYIDNATAYINGTAVTLDSAPIIRDSRTYTPARFVAEALGAEVLWDDYSKTVIIEAKK